MSTNTIVERAHLFCTEGSSDKEYLATIERTPSGGFVVNFGYGRRGSPLKTGTKTNKEVSPVQAKLVFDKLVAEKTAKGYTPDESGAAYAHSADEGRVSGHAPQLCNSISEDEAAELVSNPAWWAQEKHDGERRAVRVAGEVHGINRRGLVVAVPADLAAAAEAIGIGTTLDGEAMGEALVAFDIVEHKGVDLRPSPFRARFAILEGLALSSSGPITVSPVARTSAEKARMVEDVRTRGGEGVIFRRADAPYTAGRPSSGGDVRKLKFTASATVEVTAVNTGRSVAVAALGTAGEKVPVGNVTVPANQAIPAPGDLVEVRYLYAYRGGSLYQPVLLGVRTDIEAADRLDTLQFKGEAQD